jgi:hypothetical protein
MARHRRSSNSSGPLLLLPVLLVAGATGAMPHYRCNACTLVDRSELARRLAIASGCSFGAP